METVCFRRKNPHQKSKYQLKCDKRFLLCMVQNQELENICAGHSKQIMCAQEKLGIIQWEFNPSMGLIN